MTEESKQCPQCGGTVTVTTTYKQSKGLGRGSRFSRVDRETRIDKVVCESCGWTEPVRR